MDVGQTSQELAQPSANAGLCCGMTCSCNVVCHQMSVVSQAWDGQLTTENTIRSTNADLMLGQRRRRWANIKTALLKRFSLFSYLAL